jgi:hypothetical protein
MSSNAQAWFTIVWQYAVLIAVLAVFLRLMYTAPSITGWQQFLDSFETKGGQLMLLWVTDFIVLGVVVHFWKTFDAQLQTFIIGLLGGINGAFLGAIGARNTGGNGGPPKADKLVASFVPAEKK